MGLDKKRGTRNGTNGHGRSSAAQSLPSSSRSSRVNGFKPPEFILARLQSPLPQTNLSDEELEKFRSMLLAKRAELLGDVTNMENEALGKNRSDAAGDLSQMPIHMADIGTDNYEQEFTLGLVASEREMLKEIDAALARIDDKTYGICLGTHKPISRARLLAKPWAQYCIEYTRSHESDRRG